MTDEDPEVVEMHGMQIEVMKDAEGGWTVHAEACEHMTPQDVIMALNAIRIAMFDMYEAAREELAQRN